MSKWFLMFSSLILGVSGQLCMKKGISMLDGVGFLPISSMIRTLFQPYVFTGFVLYGISSLIWLIVISKLPLSVAYPMLSLGYVLVMVISWMIFKEPITALKFLGAGFICIGVFLIAK